jgi:hypothetical protein
LNRVIGNDLHSAAGANRFLRFGHGVQTERHFFPTGDHHVLKNFPGPAKIDYDRAIGNQERDRNLIFVWRF